MQSIRALLGENVKECVIGEDVVLNKEDPILLFEQTKKQAQH